MASVMQLDILSPDECLFQADDVSYVEVQTTEGGIGILPHHATMIAALDQAPLKLRNASGKVFYMAIDGGFLEVKDNKVTVLSVGAQKAKDIDPQKAQEEFDRAKAKIDNPPEGVDMADVIRSFRSAQTRLKTVSLATGHKYQGE